MTFGEMVIAKSLASVSDVESCTRHRDHLRSIGVEKSLAQIMHERELLTLIEMQDVLDALAEADSDEEQPIPGYRIETKLGRGQNGTVYLARQMGLDRQVAIKILAAHLATKSEYLARFRQECKAAARVNHPNIVRALTAGEAGGFYYLVMEYVDGFTTHDMLGAGHDFSEAEVIDIGLQLTEALATLHRQKLLHRDIKPSNIILTGEGQAKLCDLGLAKELDGEANLTKKGMILGTPFYLSPEAIEAQKEPDIRTDIYSLGATLFALATGAPPVEGETTTEILTNGLNGIRKDPLRLNPNLSTAMVVFLQVCMATDRNERYQTPDEMKKALQAVQAGETPPLPVADRLGMTVKRIEGLIRTKLFSWKRDPDTWGNKRSRDSQ